MGLQFDLPAGYDKNNQEIQILDAYAHITDIRYRKEKGAFYVNLKVYLKKAVRDAGGVEIFSEGFHISKEDFQSIAYDTNLDISDAVTKNAYTVLKTLTKIKNVNPIDVLED
jgi:hypothetical protein